MRASDRIEWPSELKPHEYPTGVLEHMDNRIIDATIDVRLISDYPLLPSTVPEAHVRFTGSANSEHYAVGRLSGGSDLFCLNNKHAWRIWESAKQVTQINGLGIYFDKKWAGQKRTMFHFDVRYGKRIIWLVTNYGEYVYLHRDPVRFYNLFAAEMRGL